MQLFLAHKIFFDEHIKWTPLSSNHSPSLGKYSKLLQLNNYTSLTINLAWVAHLFLLYIFYNKYNIIFDSFVEHNMHEKK